MKSAQKICLLAAMVAGLITPAAALAEEGGSGHYLPGAMASFIDGVPAAPVFLARLNVIDYKGSASPSIRLPVGVAVVGGIDAKIRGYGLSLVWRPDIDIGEGWSYAMGTTIPLINTRVSATAAIRRVPGRSISLSDEETGLGDIILQPVMLSRIFNPDFKINSRLTVYAPTGEYSTDRLANTGKNFWTVSPSLEFMYFGQKNGIEASLFAGLDFNKENPDTHYQSGRQFHLDGTLAQHFPLWGGLAGAGISALYYKQVSDDSGSGATLGAFRAKTVAYGPALSYSSKVGGSSITGELKWLHEVETENRLKGDTIFFKLVSTF